MSHAFEAPLTQLREELLMMSSLAERNAALALRALVERDDTLADTVESEDNEIDQLEIHIDELVITYMATRAPVASDCRLMICASKVSANLERIGDEATTIARCARRLNKEPQLKPFIDIPIMAETAQEMLREAINAYVDGNVDAAPDIIARDKSVDAIHRDLVRELTACMAQDPKNIARCLDLIRVAKAFERIADHAANIAEEIFYLYRARDIRHDKNIKTMGASAA